MAGAGIGKAALWATAFAASTTVLGILPIRDWKSPGKVLGLLPFKKVLVLIQAGFFLQAVISY